MEEYLLSQKVDDVKENLTEMAEVEQIPKCICVGLSLLYSFTKAPGDFKKIYQMIAELTQDAAVRLSDIEEGYGFLCNSTWKKKNT